MTEQQLIVITELLSTYEILSIENSGDKATDDNIILVLDSKRIVKIFFKRHSTLAAKKQAASNGRPSSSLRRWFSNLVSKRQAVHPGRAHPSNTSTTLPEALIHPCMKHPTLNTKKAHTGHRGNKEQWLQAMAMFTNAPAANVKMAT